MEQGQAAGESTDGRSASSSDSSSSSMCPNMSLQPPIDYDPRRLFPFGLSPIPEVPSELASEVSSLASYSPTPSLEDSDTEIESVRSRGSIMYSGSCDSIKSNCTLHDKSSESDTETETDHESNQETEDECEGYKVENIPNDSESLTLVESSATSENASQDYKKAGGLSSEATHSVGRASGSTLYNSEVTQVMHQRKFLTLPSDANVEKCASTNESNLEEKVPVPIYVEPHTIPAEASMMSGAATASEIFRHLQATRGKQEVTTELAKILTVLKTTLSNDDKDSSSSDEEADAAKSQQLKSVDPMPTGKPPRPPQKSKSFKGASSISPIIQARIKELETSKSGNPKEEMNLLSKILVHLLCSCKTAAATEELKRIIKQFKEVAKVAMEEGDDDVSHLRSSSRASSRNSCRRRPRSRTASGNSNNSGYSETDSQNTLTPGNTDSKSSGTDDETGQENSTSNLRFNVNINRNQTFDSDSCVSYTLTLPRRKQEPESQEAVPDENEDENEVEDEDEEWEWEYEESVKSRSSSALRQRQDSESDSRNISPGEGKSDASTSSTRNILNDMEMGAYNSGSTSHSDHGNSQSTPITEDEDVFTQTMQNEEEILCSDKKKKWVGEKVETNGHLFCHLEETFKVLSDTYKIITTGNSNETEQNTQWNTPVNKATIKEGDASFEDILDGVSTQCVQLESEILRSSRQSTATPETKSPQSGKIIMYQRPSSRTNSRLSRPSSRLKPKTPLPDGEEEEQWGDDDEWEYYYEDEEEQSQPDQQTNRPVSQCKSEHEAIKSRPASRIKSRPTSRQDIEAGKRSRPVSRAMSVKNSSTSEQEEDWDDEEEWEYYYEDEEGNQYEITDETQENISSRPKGSLSRANSRQGTRPSSRCTKIVVSRASSRQEVHEEKEIMSGHHPAEEVKADLVCKPRSNSRQGSRPPSRTKSQASNRPSQSADDDEDWGDEDEWEYYYEDEGEPEAPTAPENVTIEKSQLDTRQTGTHLKVPSRPNSRQSNVQSRPNSRSGSRPTSRSASRIKHCKSSLGNVEEESEYEWYYDDGEDPELTRLSPTMTTAPTTRATSPFPNDKENMENRGTGFSSSHRRMAPLMEENSPQPPLKEQDVHSGSATPKVNLDKLEKSLSASKVINDETKGFCNVTGSDVGYLNPMAGVSVALAAEYLGQDTQELVASLPPEFIEENQVKLKEKSKKKHRSSSEKYCDETSECGDKKKKKKKKKGDGKFLPKIGVKDLVNKLEPQLFQDNQVGKKMVISKDEARDVIRESKKKSITPESFQDLRQEGGSNQGMGIESDQKSEKRKSVREMVQLMSHQGVTTDEQSTTPVLETGESKSCKTNFNIPSISVSSNAPPPPVPPPPQGYYVSPSPQYPSHYQQYPQQCPPQYPPQPYQQPNQGVFQYPPQSPYSQYQQYPPYPPYPGPPPQPYQQFPQQYPQYPPQIQPYPTGYVPYSQPQMVYHSDTNPNQMTVVSGGQTTQVTMRQKVSNSKQKENSRHRKSSELTHQQRQSPEDSEAYGTGSTGSDQTEGQVGGIEQEEATEAETGKPQKRHSRLFKLLQDSDYTDSETDSKNDFSRISMKNVEDHHSRESDIDSVSSGIERKHSFRSHKSSNKESDNDSVTSSGMERKISPNSVQKNLTTRRLMHLNLQSCYEPSSSELSTPNSPTVPQAELDRRKRSLSKPPTRMWNYLNDELDNPAGISDDSSYQSLQSLNSYDSVLDSVSGHEVEEIMKRKVNRDNLYRYQADSPGGYVRASPKGVEYLRGSPKTNSPKSEVFTRASPKLEQELMELTNFPSSPGLTLRQLHRGYYGAGGGSK